MKKWCGTRYYKAPEIFLHYQVRWVGGLPSRQARGQRPEDDVLFALHAAEVVDGTVDAMLKRPGAWGLLPLS